MKYFANIESKQNFEVTKEQAFEVIQAHPKVTIDVYNNDGSKYSSFGCVYAFEVINNTKQKLYWKGIVYAGYRQVCAFLERIIQQLAPKSFCRRWNNL
jgi:hypothetical protein